jgi:hypothetical protein
MQGRWGNPDAPAFVIHKSAPRANSDPKKPDEVCYHV